MSTWFMDASLLEKAIRKRRSKRPKLELPLMQSTTTKTCQKALKKIGTVLNIFGEVTNTVSNSKIPAKGIFNVTILRFDKSLVICQFGIFD